ncbi:MAG: universal stress protein, partial [Solirubrobacterales bacterium]
AIAEACEEAAAELLVCGSRHYGPVLRVLLGSVSTQLAHKAACAVLVVPRPPKHPEKGDGEQQRDHQLA